MAERKRAVELAVAWRDRLTALAIGPVLAYYLVEMARDDC